MISPYLKRPLRALDQVKAQQTTTDQTPANAEPAH